MLEDIRNPREIMEHLISIDETAAILGISKKTLYTWICRRKIDFVKMGNRVLFEPQYIRDYIKRHTIRSLIK